MHEAYDFSEQYLFPCIFNVTDIDKLIEYFFQHTSVPFRFGEQFENLLYLKTERYFELFKVKAVMYEEKYRTNLELQKYGYNYGCTNEELEQIIKKRKEFVNEETAQIEDILNSPDLLSKYTDILEKRKIENLEKLKNYGIPIA